VLLARLPLLLSQTKITTGLLGQQSFWKHQARQIKARFITSRWLAGDSDLGVCVKKEPAELLAANPAGFE